MSKKIFLLAILSFNLLFFPVSALGATVIPIKNQTMFNNLQGKIIIAVEQNGEAYYLDPVVKKIFSLGRPQDAFTIMSQQGIGITNQNLEKIPIALTNATGQDADQDGLQDLLESALGTNLNKSDTDGDGYSDKLEIQKDYSPLSGNRDRMPLDLSFAHRQSGKILLQTEKKGEAWYVNPQNNKRYFLSRPADAFNIMRQLSLGISNKDFAQLAKIDDQKIVNKYEQQILTVTEVQQQINFLILDNQKSKAIQPGEEFNFTISGQNLAAGLTAGGYQKIFIANPNNLTVDYSNTLEDYFLIFNSSAQANDYFSKFKTKVEQLANKKELVSAWSALSAIGETAFKANIVDSQNPNPNTLFIIVSFKKNNTVAVLSLFGSKNEMTEAQLIALAKIQSNKKND